MTKLLIAITLLVGMMGTAQAETITVSVNGLVCSFCATGIKKTFGKLEAVSDVAVDLNTKLVTVQTKRDQTIDNETVTKFITDAGYTVTNISRGK